MHYEFNLVSRPEVILHLGSGRAVSRGRNGVPGPTGFRQWRGSRIGGRS